MNDNDFETEYDSLKDVAEYQENMYNPGHYIATGRVKPTVSAPGNATPLAIAYFLGAIVTFVFGLVLCFSDIRVIIGPIESSVVTKTIALVTMTAISAGFAFLGFRYLKKAKQYYKEKTAMENEPVDESQEDKIWQRKCPQCGKPHDIDYPKCPHCRFDYTK